MPIDRKVKLSAHFTVGEFVRPGVDPSPVVMLNLRKLAEALEEVRAKLGERPIIITSGYRTVEHNRSVGGVRNSTHTKGMAADIAVVGLTPRQVQQRLGWWIGGMGCYETFTHLDMGNNRRWDG